MICSIDIESIFVVPLHWLILILILLFISSLLFDKNDLTFLRIRSKKHEIMVAPDKDFLLVVIQDPTISNKK